MNQKAPKQQRTQNVVSLRDKTRTVFHLLLCKLFEDFRHGSELIHEVRAPQTVADLYQQKDYPSCKGQLETE